MAKTEVEIQAELIESINSTDQTLDTAQGPIPDLFIRPQAGQLAQASSEAESLRTLFTLQFGTAATEEEIQNALANYGSAPGAGVAARHVQHFLRFTRPTVDISIPTGSLVSNSDSSLVYRVLNGGTILANASDSYYNPSRNSYEIGLLVEGTGIGTTYNLPSGRITNIVTPIPGIDTTENRSKSTGGLDKESTDSQSSRLKTSLTGINLGAPGGIQSRILNAFPESVTDVAVIQPFEKEFTRLITGPALDVYALGATIEPATQTVIAVNGQTIIPLLSKPAFAITSVTINNVVITSGYTLVKDSSFEYGYSLQASDQLVLSIPLLAGDTVVIEYEYNKILTSIFTDVLDSGNEFLFNTDILMRSPFQISPIISGTVQALASFSTNEVEENINTFLATNFNFTIFTEIVFPEVIRQRLITEVSGVQNFRLTEFRRSTGSLSTIEPMSFARNEVSVYDANLINIRIAR
jgi:hypothetical protein